MGTMTADRIVLLVVLLSSPACTGETLGPASGALEMTASVVGEGSDPDGFLVVVSGTIEHRLVPGLSVLLNAIAPGEYEVALEGIGPNCTPLGPARQSTTVVAGDTAQVAFEVTCHRANGMLVVTVQTNGSDRDPSGYDVMVDDDSAAAVESDGVVLVTVPAGDRTVRLGAVNPNCSVEPTSRSLAISIGGLATAEFEIQCTASARAGRGHEIAYTSSDAFGGQSAIYVVNDDGSHTERLFPDIQPPHAAPAWAPDGTHIAFYTTPASTGPLPVDSFLLTIADVQGGGRREFAGPSSAIAWSPDGIRLALARTSGPVPVGLAECPPVRLFHIDGSGEEAFNVGCDADGLFGAISWSPDGHRIAFVVNVVNDTTNTGILRLADLALPGQSTPPPGCDFPTVHSVSWSPDPSRLAVAADGIFVLDLAAATCTRLTDDPSDDSPSWSPDGSRLVFSRLQGNREIYVMQADGSHQTRVTRSPLNDGAPNWRP